MLKLYGFDVSNYYNMVKLALAIKGVDYEAVLVYPNQSSEYLTISHMGKVPALQTEQGLLIETNVILEYLDAAYPQNPLYPGDAFAQAKIREMVKLIELYIELPARRCHGAAFFGGETPELTQKEVKRALYKGIEALARVAQCKPYLMGEQFTAADIMLLYTCELAGGVAKRLFNFDLFDLAPGTKDLIALLNTREDVKKIAADKKLANVAFKQYVAEAMAKAK